MHVGLRRAGDPVFHGPVFPCPRCARIEDVEGMAKVIAETPIKFGEINECIARAVSAWLKEGK
jgi:hypothetical protein